MKFQYMFGKYLNHVRKYRKQGTYMSYKKDFKLLSKTLKFMKVSDTNEIDENFFEEMTDYMLVHTNKKNSKINDTISSCITVFNFFGVKYPRRYKLLDDTTPFKAVNRLDYNKLISYIELLDISVMNNLSLALVIFLSLDSGVRLSELIDIRFENVDFTTNTIYLVHTKNNKNRFVFFGDLSEKLLKKAKTMNKKVRFKADYKGFEKVLRKHLDSFNEEDQNELEAGLNYFRIMDKRQRHMFLDNYKKELFDFIIKYPSCCSIKIDDGINPINEYKSHEMSGDHILDMIEELQIVDYQMVMNYEQNEKTDNTLYVSRGVHINIKKRES